MTSKLGTTENIFTSDGEVEGVINSSGDVIISTLNPEFRTTQFLPVDPGERYIFYTQEDGLRRVQVIGFYTKERVFISRQTTDTYQMQTPQNCYFVRLTSAAGMNGFYSRFMITRSILCPYVPHYFLTNVETTEKRLYDLQMKVDGLSSVVDEILCPYTIGHKPEGDVWLNVPETRHIMIPIKEGDRISLSAGAYTGIYALLKSRKFFVNESPDFVNKYTVEYSDIGEPTFVVETDEYGHPIADERHAVTSGSTVSLIAVPESSYLYCSYSYVDTLGNDIYNGLNVVLNGVKLYVDDTKQQDADNIYETIFFDDFDYLNTDVWTLHTEDAPSDGQYRSRFKTNSDNVRCEQSTLVMKVFKVPPGDNGTYIAKDGTVKYIDYLAPYISTCDSFAVPRGRISARFRTSKPLSKDFFVGCLWTFGQNAPWGYAHEPDIMETTQSVLTEGAYSKSGVWIPAGSIRSVASFNLHTRNSVGENKTFSTLALISIALKNGNTYEDDQVFYSFKEGFDMSKWHVYTIEWDTENIYIFIDDELFASYNAEKIDAVDENGRIGFYHPQDIRFNLKCDSDLAEDDGYLFVDWVKVEVINKTPCTSISFSDFSLSVGEGKYIEPDFNLGCTNKAFSLATEDSSVIRIDKYLSSSSAMVIHKIVGLAPGVATVTLTSANEVVHSQFIVTVT